MLYAGRVHNGNRLRKQDARRKKTTMALLTSVIEVLIEKGYAALTMAEVAERAGVSWGALNHYYPTKEKMVIAASRYAMEEEMLAIAVAAPEKLTRRQAFDAFFEASERFFLSRSFVAQIELVFAAQHDAKVGDAYFPQIGGYRRAFDVQWRTVLIGAGMDADDAMDLIDMTNNMLRGMGLSMMRGLGPTGGAGKLERIRARLHQQFGGD